MTIPTSSLFGYWTLNETATPCLDSVGGRSLTWGGGASSGTGKIGNGIVFDPSGTLDYLQHQFSGAPSLSTETVTVSLWVKVNETGREQRHIRVSYTSLYNRVLEIVQLSSDLWRAHFVTEPGANRYGTGTNIATASVGTWFHLVSRFLATDDGMYCDITVNGVKGDVPTTVTGSTKKVLLTAASGAYLLISRGDSGTSYYSKATIDEVAIFNAYLTDAQVLELYNSGNGLAYPFTSGTLTDNYGAFLEPLRKPFIGAFG